MPSGFIIPNRLLHPLRRVGKKGAGEWQRISWDEAMTRSPRASSQIEREHGPEAVWPYFYAGTMGHVHRDGIERLRHARGYSRQYDTICTGTAWPGFLAGTGKLPGPNPEEMAETDCVVIWGTNAVDHPGQRDDPRRPRPQGARRQDRRHRHLPQRHHGAGRHGPGASAPAPTARWPWR